MQVKTLPGKTLVGVNKATKAEVAHACRVQVGDATGWLVEKEGQLCAIEKSWDDCSAHFKRMGLTVRIK